MRKEADDEGEEEENAATVAYEKEEGGESESDSRVTLTSTLRRKLARENHGCKRRTLMCYECNKRLKKQQYEPQEQGHAHKGSSPNTNRTAQHVHLRYLFGV